MFALKQRLHGTIRWLTTHATAVNSVAGVVVSLRERPGPLAIAGAVASLATLAGQWTKAPAIGTWLGLAEKLEVAGVNLIDALVSFQVNEKPGDCDWTDWTIYRIGGATAAVNKNSASTVHFRGGSADELRAALREAAWRADHLRVKSVGEYWCKTLATVLCVEDPGLPSPVAEHLWTHRLHGFIAAGRARSMLIDGRPGTGKSNAVRWLADQVGGRRLRVPASEVAYAEPEALASLVELLRPDVVVFDDFDKAGSHDLSLDAIERVRSACRLLMATTNDVGKITQAAVRPRRFDMHATIDSFDEDFVRGFLGDVWSALAAEDRVVVGAWPIVYLDELRARAAHVRDVDLHAEVLELDRRAARRSAAAWEAKPKEDATKAEEPAPARPSRKRGAAAATPAVSKKST